MFPESAAVWQYCSEAALCAISVEMAVAARRESGVLSWRVGRDFTPPACGCPRLRCSARRHWRADRSGHAIGTRMTCRMFSRRSPADKATKGRTSIAPVAATRRTCRAGRPWFRFCRAIRSTKRRRTAPASPQPDSASVEAWQPERKVLARRCVQPGARGRALAQLSSLADSRERRAGRVRIRSRHGADDRAASAGGSRVEVRFVRTAGSHGRRNAERRRRVTSHRDGWIRRRGDEPQRAS